MESVWSIHSSIHQLRKYFKDCKAQYHINKNILGVMFAKQADIFDNEKI